MVSKCMKKWLLLLISTMGYQCICTRMTVIKKTDHQTYCADHIMMDVNERIQCRM